MDVICENKYFFSVLLVGYTIKLFQIFQGRCATWKKLSNEDWIISHHFENIVKSCFVAMNNLSKWVIETNGVKDSFDHDSHWLKFFINLTPAKRVSITLLTKTFSIKLRERNKR